MKYKVDQPRKDCFKKLHSNMNEKFDCSRYIATPVARKMQQKLLKQFFCLLQNSALFVSFYLAAVATTAQHATKEKAK